MGTRNGHLTKRLASICAAVVLATAISPVPASAETIPDAIVGTGVAQVLMQGTENAAETAASVATAEPAKKPARKTHEKQTIRIFCVGNSWTTRSVRHICSIGKSAGKRVIVGFAFLPHGSLQEHYFSARFGGGTFLYHGERTKVRSHIIYKKYLNSDKPRVRTGWTLKRAAADENWDYLVFQNRAPESGIYATWDKRARGNTDVYLKGGKRVKFDINDLDRLTESYLRPASRRKVKVGVSAVWTFPHGQRGGVADSISEYIRVKRHGKTPRTRAQWNRLYDALGRDIQETMPKVARHMGKHCDFVVNPGKVFAKARRSTKMRRFGFNLSTSPVDAHPAPGLPSYLASLSYARALLGISEDDVNWYPKVKTPSYQKKDGRLVKRVRVMSESDAERAVACAWGTRG